MNISLGFTTWKSSSWIERQLNEQDYFDISGGLIDEIIIQDDFSDDYELLQKYKSDKIKIYQNEENLSPLLSRKHLVNNCKNDWVFVMDCDNFIRKTNSDKEDIFETVIKKLDFSKQDTIYCPGFKYHFGYDKLLNNRITLDFAKKYFDTTEYYLQIFLNTGNYLVPREQYLKTCELIDKNYLYATVDVIYFNYLWMKQGNVLQCVENYEYHHTIRQDGYYITHCKASETKAQEIYNIFRTHESN